MPSASSLARYIVHTEILFHPRLWSSVIGHRSTATFILSSFPHSHQRLYPQSTVLHPLRCLLTTKSTPIMAEHQESRSKRKQPPSPANDRPMKQIKPEKSDTQSNGSHKYSSDTIVMNGVARDMEVDFEPHDLQRTSSIPITVADTAEWQETVENVVRKVVSIHFCQTCSFDTDSAVSSEATGFVVDAEKGLILTNRHVVGAGPFWGYCIFDNHEECDVYPVYRDPVHDFGFLRFDPKAIKYMAVTPLELRPEHARR
jgi:pro-apoptotic serine protease NMA111